MKKFKNAAISLEGLAADQVEGAADHEAILAIQAEEQAELEGVHERIEAIVPQETEERIEAFAEAAEQAPLVIDTMAKTADALQDGGEISDESAKALGVALEGLASLIGGHGSYFAATANAGGNGKQVALEGIGDFAKDASSKIGDFLRRLWNIIVTMYERFRDFLFDTQKKLKKLDEQLKDMHFTGGRKIPASKIAVDLGIEHDGQLAIQIDNFYTVVCGFAEGIHETTKRTIDLARDFKVNAVSLGKGGNKDLGGEYDKASENLFVETPESKEVLGRAKLKINGVREMTDEEPSGKRFFDELSSNRLEVKLDRTPNGKSEHMTGSSDDLKHAVERALVGTSELASLVNKTVVTCKGLKLPDYAARVWAGQEGKNGVIGWRLFYSASLGLKATAQSLLSFDARVMRGVASHIATMIRIHGGEKISANDDLKPAPVAA